MKPEDVPPSERARCRTCRKEVIWTQTEAGKDMPVDLAPGGYTTTGANGKPHLVPANLRLTIVGDRVLSQVVKAHLACGNQSLHLSHFVRCPQSKFWRRSSTTSSKSRNRSRR